MGRCDASTHSIMKFNNDIPLVTVVGSDVSFDIDVASTFSIHLDVPTSACGFDLSELSFEWEGLNELILPALPSFQEKFPDHLEFGLDNEDLLSSYYSIKDPIIASNKLEPLHNYAWQVKNIEVEFKSFMR